MTTTSATAARRGRWPSATSTPGGSPPPFWRAPQTDGAGSSGSSAVLGQIAFDRGGECTHRAARLPCRAPGECERQRGENAGRERCTIEPGREPERGDHRAHHEWRQREARPRARAYHLAPLAVIFHTHEQSRRAEQPAAHLEVP